MLTTTAVFRRGAIVAALCAAAGAIDITAAKQDSTSRALVRELTTILGASKFESLAAEDPTRPGHMMAVLYLPRVQLLMIAGRCDAIEAMRARLAAKAYRDVYADLHACAIGDSRLFIQDMGADGLGRQPARDGSAFDIVYERMSRQTKFDGDFKGQGLSAQEYDQRFITIETEYARLLSVLVSEFSTVAQLGGPTARR